jgi:small ligand-binding sensory domain FIST
MMDVYDTLLPPPMIPGANAGDTECLLDEEFRDLATSHNVRAAYPGNPHIGLVVASGCRPLGRTRGFLPGMLQPPIT